VQELRTTQKEKDDDKVHEDPWGMRTAPRSHHCTPAFSDQVSAKPSR